MKRVARSYDFLLLESSIVVALRDVEGWIVYGPRLAVHAAVSGRLLPDLNADISAGVGKMPGVAVTFNDECTGCGECVESGVCFVGALSTRDGRPHRDDWRCRGCGRCAEFCPHGAIDVVLDGRDVFEESVKKIQPLVDIRAE